jgi:hypothetical protein
MKGTLRRVKPTIEYSRRFSPTLSSYDWAGIHADKVQVLDPDGWDRRNYVEDMLEHITETDWWDKVAESTCKWHQPAHDYLKGLYAPPKSTFSKVLDYFTSRR